MLLLERIKLRKREETDQALQHVDMVCQGCRESTDSTFREGDQRLAKLPNA